MNNISAQVSLYPLGVENLSPVIDDALHTFKEHSLQVVMGAMSTLLSGDSNAVFSALQAAFEQASEQGRVVMVVAFSNACPAPKS